MRTILLFLIVVGLFACGGGEPDVVDPAEDPSGDGVTSGGDQAGGTDGGDVAVSAAPSRVSGLNFSVPLPAGYEQKVSGTVADMMRHDVLEPGGIILMAGASDVSGAAPGSVVVSPTVMDISSNAVDGNLCGQLAALVAGQQNATVDRASMITLPWGETCQWELVTASDEHRRRIGTVFAANAQDWIVTCNLDDRDEAARAACSRVLSGWAFAD